MAKSEIHDDDAEGGARTYAVALPPTTHKIGSRRHLGDDVEISFSIVRCRAHYATVVASTIPRPRETWVEEAGVGHGHGRKHSEHLTFVEARTGCKAVAAGPMVLQDRKCAEGCFVRMAEPRGCLG